MCKLRTEQALLEHGVYWGSGTEGWWWYWHLRRTFPLQ